MNSQGKGIWLLLSFVLVFSTIRSQDNTLFILLMKGTARVTSEITKEVIEFHPGNRKTLPLSASLILSANSNAIVYNSNGSEEIGSVRAEKYQTTILINALNKKLKSNAALRFYDFLNRTYAEMKKKEELKGSVTGAGIRGTNNTDFYYSPNDSTNVIGDTLILAWGPDEYYKLNNNLVVINISQRDTVYNNSPIRSLVILYNLNEGKYHWSGIIKPKAGKMLQMDNVFYIPSDSLKIILKKDLQQFKETISKFKSETKISLLDEYLNQTKIYTGKH